MIRKLTVKYRLLKRLKFRFVRSFVYFGFKLWLKQVHDRDRLPIKGPAIIVSNHTSYFDWSVLSAVYDKKYIVFLGNKELLDRPFVGWLMKLNILIFVDKENPRFSYYKEIIRRLKQGHIVVIYPEGTRSKSGKMIEPKIGFVKLAIMTGAPVIPLGMKGVFEILPPNKIFPRLRRCEMFIGKPLVISKNNTLFRGILQNKEGSKPVSDDAARQIAIIIMGIIQRMTGQPWDDTVRPDLYNLKIIEDKLLAA